MNDSPSLSRKLSRDCTLYFSSSQLSWHYYWPILSIHIQFVSQIVITVLESQVSSFQDILKIKIDTSRSLFSNVRPPTNFRFIFKYPHQVFDHAKFLFWMDEFFDIWKRIWWTYGRFFVDFRGFWGLRRVWVAQIGSSRKGIPQGNVYGSPFFQDSEKPWKSCRIHQYREIFNSSQN